MKALSSLLKFFGSVVLLVLILIGLFIFAFLERELHIGEVDDVVTVFQTTCEDSTLSVERYHHQGGFDAPSRTSFHMKYEPLVGEAKSIELEPTAEISSLFRTHHFAPESSVAQSNYFTETVPLKNQHLIFDEDDLSEKEFDIVARCLSSNYTSFSDRYRDITSIRYINDTNLYTSKFICSNGKELYVNNVYGVDYIVMKSSPAIHFPIAYLGENSGINYFDYPYIVSEVDAMPTSNRYRDIARSRLQAYASVEKDVPELLASCKTIEGKTMVDYFTVN